MIGGGQIADDGQSETRSADRRVGSLSPLQDAFGIVFRDSRAIVLNPELGHIANKPALHQDFRARPLVGVVDEIAHQFIEVDWINGHA